MKKLIIGILILCMSSCQKRISETNLLNKANPDGLYGKGITLKIKNELEILLSQPSNYLDKNILISGEITEVCPMRGCWIDVKDIKSDSHIRIKVTDGEIVFPLSAKGRYIDVQGKFIKLNFTKEQAINWKIHLGEEQGVILSPQDIEITPSDLVEYRINGTGANIYSYDVK